MKNRLFIKVLHSKRVERLNSSHFVTKPYSCVVCFNVKIVNKQTVLLMEKDNCHIYTPKMLMLHCYPCVATCISLPAIVRNTDTIVGFLVCVSRE